MEENFPVRTPSLADQVYEIVLGGISDGTYPPGGMLPSENQLAKQYQVSRPTIRVAIARLAERGYVNRRRGVGTIVAETPSIVYPLYQFLDIVERISSRGFKPGFQQIKSQIIPATEEIGNKLELPRGSEVLNIHKLFTADDRPIIYFENYIPRWVFGDCLTDEEAVKPGISEPFFIFFRETCQQPVHYLTSIIRPELSIALPQTQLLGIATPEETMLHIEDVGFNSDDTPVFFSNEYLFNEASSLHVIRNVQNG